jgi:hypothetical protein
MTGASARVDKKKLLSIQSDIGTMSKLRLSLRFLYFNPNLKRQDGDLSLQATLSENLSHLSATLESHRNA